MREASFLPSQITQYQEAQDISQIDVGLHGSGAGEVELGVLMC